MADLNPVRGLGKLIEVFSGASDEKLKVFVGRRVVAVWAPAGARDVAFELDDGAFICADPEGDCCSTSWVEHVSGVRAAIGAEFVSVDERPELESHKNVEDSGFESLALYGITLVTDRGERVDIDYRNESNGYYGGWLNWRRLEGALPEGWAQITEDF